MTPDLLFQIAGPVAIVGWLGLILLPHSVAVREILVRGVVAGLLGVAYLLIVVLVFPGTEGGFGSLAGVAQLFTNPWMLLAGWLHYLAFDLLVGAMIVERARVAAIPHLAVVPILVLTFLFGPVGWIAFLAIRTVAGRAQVAA